MKKYAETKIRKTFLSFGAKVCCLAAACFSAAGCSENAGSILPGKGKEAYVNFYNMSEVLLSPSLAENNMVYIDDSVPHGAFPRFPQFLNVGGDLRQYPYTYTGSSWGISDNAAGSGSGNLFWMPIASGSYKFIYTSVNKVFLKDTTLALAPKTFTTQYLAESPSAGDAYVIVTVPVFLEGTPGKTRVQILNLSPDLGPLDAYQTDENNREIPSSLPQGLPFGGYNRYAELDTAGADRYGHFLLKFRKHGGTKPLLSFPLPAFSGASYTLVVRGFAGEALRRIKTGEGLYASVVVPPDLRITLRRVY